MNTPTHTPFNEGDAVRITSGALQGQTGQVVDCERPILWVKLSATNEVANVHENDMELVN